jgi:predicted protein tyrosine phosphatase
MVAILNQARSYLFYCPSRMRRTRARTAEPVFCGMRNIGVATEAETTAEGTVVAWLILVNKRRRRAG